MGSGKSFECVRSVIVPAIANGRRVVSNIEGLNEELIKAYCVDVLKIDDSKLGSLLHVSNDEVRSELFFPFGKEEVETTCRGGDLICIDEAWRFFGTDCKLLENHKIFFREHRHYVNPETKVSCDLVLMVQDITDVHRQLKVVIEMTFRTTKLKSLGAHNAYRVEMWEGYKLTIKGRAGLQIKKYDKKIFPLYQSYTGGAGNEKVIDSRQNVITPAKIAVFVGALVVLCVGIYFVMQRFNPAAYGIEEKPNDEKTDVLSSAGNAVVSSTQQAQVYEPSQAPIGQRVIGVFESEGKKFVIYESNKVHFLEHPSNFSNTENLNLISGTVDGATLRKGNYR